MRGYALITALLLALAMTACRSSNTNDGETQPSANFPQGTAPTTEGGDTAGVEGMGRDATMVLVRAQALKLRNDKGQETQLVRVPNDTFPSFPVFSPDGEQIAYVRSLVFTGRPNSDWGSDIYVIPITGGTPQLVWKHEQAGAQVQGLAWTPDGTGLLLGYQLTLIQDGKYQGQKLRIERLDLASGTRTPVVDGAIYPSLTRDGSRMAYMTQDGAGNGGLWVANDDGSGAKQIVELGGKFTGILYPRIAPDGSRVCFGAATQRASVPDRDAPGERAGAMRALRALLGVTTASGHGLPMDVWCVGAADGSVQRLTNFGEDEPAPAWSCDRKSLTIFSTGGLYTISADGSALKKIAPGSFGGQQDMRCT